MDRVGAFRPSLAIAAMLIAAQADAATCYGRVAGGEAEITCAGTSAHVEDCTFAWPVSADGQYSTEWRGSFQANYMDRGALKAHMGGIAAATGNLDYTCAMAASDRDVERNVSLDNDAVDAHGVESAHHEMAENAKVAAVEKHRSRRPCTPHQSAAERARTVKGYDQSEALTCTPGS